MSESWFRQETYVALLSYQPIGSNDETSKILCHYFLTSACEANLQAVTKPEHQSQCCAAEIQFKTAGSASLN